MQVIGKQYSKQYSSRFGVTKTLISSRYLLSSIMTSNFKITSDVSKK